MPLEFYWQLPTNQDARHGDATRQRRGEATDPHYPVFGNGITDPRRHTFNYYDYLHQVAKGADLSGFDGLHIPDYPDGEESWIVAGYVARDTRHLKLITQFDAARGSAVYAAKNAVSFQRYTHGRFAWQITEGNPDASQRRRAADFIASEDILPRIDEFIQVSRGVLTSHPYNFKGRFFEVQNGGFQGPLSNHPLPKIYLSGISSAGLELSARQADVHVFDADHPDLLAEKIRQYQAQAAKAGRTPALALRIDLLARETLDEARFDATRHQAQVQGSENIRAPLLGSLLWHGYSTQATGASAALIGDYQAVAEALAHYARLGITQFILAASPHFEEVYRVGAHVLPLVRALSNPLAQRAA